MASISSSVSERTLPKPRSSRAIHEIVARRAEVFNTAFFFAMVLVAAIPLILFRGNDWLTFVTPAAMMVEIALGLAWWRYGQTGVPLVANVPRDWRLAALVAAVLLLVTWLGFYVPQLKHFWGGYDDFVGYQPTVPVLWGESYDHSQNRPAMGWAYLLGHLLAGGRIEGFLWLSTIEAFVGAWLVWLILQTVLPGARSLALGAAALYVVNRADPLKFYPTWAANPYGLAVVLLLLAGWLFVVSWQRQNRVMLVASCLSLMASLATYETGYLLAGLPILYVWMRRRRDSQWRFWIAAWISTVALMAMRFALFLLMSERAYQNNMVKSANLGIAPLIKNLRRHLEPFQTFFDFQPDASSHWLPACVVFAATASAVWWLSRSDQITKPAQWLVVIGVATLGVVLAVAPYAHVAGNERTQFFAAPALAVLAAALFGAGTSVLPKRLAQLVFCTAIGVLCGNATAQSLRSQSADKGVTYEKTVHVFEQIHALSPTLSPDTLIVLAHRNDSPLGVDYCADCTSEVCGIGCRVLSIGGGMHRYLMSEFREKDINITGFANTTIGYDRLVVYRLDSDGTLHFCSEWPSDVFGPQGASHYAPLQRMQPGTITPLRYLNYPSWKQRPLDVVRQNAGVVLGRGWSPRRFANGWLYREVEQDCELVVNAQGQSHYDLDLDIAPAARNGMRKLEVLNSKNETVANLELPQRKRVHLTLPCDVGQIEVFRLRLGASTTPTPGTRAVARIYCNGEQLDANPLPQLADVIVGDIELGAGWYPRESFQGLQLRWLNTDGIIITGPCDAGQTPVLVMEVTPGPGLGGRPCTIELIDENGATLASHTVTARERVTFNLPVDLPERTPLTVRVLGGGKQVPPDPRVLNLMVTRCEWQSTAVL